MGHLAFKLMIMYFLLVFSVKTRRNGEPPEYTIRKVLYVYYWPLPRIVKDNTISSLWWNWADTASRNFRALFNASLWNRPWRRGNYYLPFTWVDYVLWCECKTWPLLNPITRPCEGPLTANRRMTLEDWITRPRYVIKRKHMVLCII